MNDYQRAMRKALAAAAKARRTQRGKRKPPPIGPGMIRRAGPDHPAPGGVAQEGTTA